MREYLQVLVALSAYFGLTVPLVARENGDQDLLEFVRDAHRASRESIRTLSCRVEFQANINSKNPPEIQTCSGHYWYSPDAVRSKRLEFGEEHDYLWKDSVRQVVVYKLSGGKRVAVGANRKSFATRYLSRCDAYTRGLLVLNTPDTIIDVPFEQLLEQATKIRKTRRSTINGKEMIVVHLNFARKQPDDANWEVEIQFDPEVNYLVRRTKYVGTYPSGDYWREDEVTQFKECAPGLFFPEKAVGRAGPDKTCDFTQTAAISDIHVNEPLPDSIFRFRYPYGVYLSDSDRKVRYRVDTQGNRISPEQPLAGIPPPPSVGDLDVSNPGRETETEPQPLTRWILPISFCIVVCGCLGIILRRWRGKATAP